MKTTECETEIQYFCSFVCLVILILFNEELESIVFLHENLHIYITCNGYENLLSSLPKYVYTGL